MCNVQCAVCSVQCAGAVCTYALTDGKEQYIVSFVGLIRTIIHEIKITLHSSINKPKFLLAMRRTNNKNNKYFNKFLKKLIRIVLKCNVSSHEQKSRDTKSYSTKTKSQYFIPLSFSLSIPTNTQLTILIYTLHSR